MTLLQLNRSRGDCCDEPESSQARLLPSAIECRANSTISRRIAGVILSLVAFVANCPNSFGQIDTEPVMRLEADGPTSYVTSLAFSPDGQTLYAGSWDKTVYVWKWAPAVREFRLDPRATLRVPIGPGLDGAINTIAVSPDGNWVAAAGTSPMRGAADFRRPGQVIPTLGGLTSEMRQDAGTIYVFNIHSGQTHSLRGHSGEVRALTFAPSEGQAPLLVSAAREWNEKTSQHEGIVRCWQSLDDNARPRQQILPVPSGKDALWATWPKLAARRTGTERDAIEVAIAWGDDTFRLWDVGRDRIVEATRQGRFQDVVALQSQASQFFSGAMGEDESLRLRAWKPRSSAGLEADSPSSIDLPRSRDYRIIPRQLAFAASSPGKNSDVMCVVVHRNVVRNSASDQYELWLYRAPFRSVAPRTITLWLTGPPPRRTPQIATSPGREHLAISREGEIYLYSVADVLAGNNRPKVLRNAGAAFDEVKFVRKRGAADASLGIRLSGSRLSNADSSPPTNQSPIVFDLVRGALEPQTAADGWALAPAVLGNWRIEAQTTSGIQPAARQLVISQGGQRRGVIPLPATADRSIFALAANARPPIVGLATYDNGLPALGLYDAISGQQVRQLTSHSARIRSLAFSDDGRLLASVADDETVCLWRLDDLERIVGKRGKSPGIAVRQASDGLLVKLDDPAGAGGLREGELLTGRVTSSGTNPWASPREFYDAFWNATPGESIRVKRRQANGAVDEVLLPVAQGIDERKPLFSLFIARGQAGRSRGWIGWSPLGPFQSSDREIERCLGWHFNTGRSEAPVAFAGAAQYRDKYYRPGLFDSLIKTGQPPETKQASLPSPILDLVVDGSEPAPGGNAEDVLIRQPPEKASLLVANLTAEQIERIELILDGRSLGRLEAQDDGATWSALLTGANWRPGEYRLKAVVHTRESAPQRFDIERHIRFQVPAPQVKLDASPVGVSGLQIDQSSLGFAAMIEPGRSGEPTDVVLKQKQSGNETILKRWTTSERLEIKETIEIAEGGSQLEIVARNRDALPGYETQETESKKLAVNRHRTLAPPPVLANAQVETILPGQPSEPFDVGHGPRKVTVNRVRLSGEITGAKGDFVVESSIGAEEGAALRIDPAADGKPAQFRTDVIELQPGPQTLLVRRKVLEGPIVTTTIELDYIPPLPDLTIERPEQDQTLIAGRDSDHVDVQASWSDILPDSSLQASILINGRPFGGAPVIDREGRKITASVPLSAGENIIELKLWNKWNEGRTQRVANVRYLHLPSIDRIEAKNEQLPVLELTLAGQSATPVTRVEVGPDVLPASAIQYDTATGHWQATARAARRNAAYELTVQARNRDGQSLAPGKWQVPAWRQLEPPPVIELATSGNVTAASYDLQFTVRSRSKLRSINIKHNRQPIEFDPKLPELTPDANGGFVFTATVPVRLVSGDNRFDVLAANDGGAEAQQSLVNYIDPPARITIDHLETVGGGAQRLTLPVIVQDRHAHAQGTAPTGKVLVRGRVNWPLSTDKTYLARKQRLQLWVNGFQQAPGVLDQPTNNSSSSDFTAFAVLNKKEANHVQLALPDLTPDVSTLFDFEVDCAEPVVDQRLHVLIVGVGVARGSEPELEGRVLAALQAKPLREKLWRSVAFSQIAAYGPLVGNDITPQQVRNQLSTIKLKIDELYHANRSSARPANDVVMIYLQGGALINVDGSFFVTTRPASDPRTNRAVSQLEPRILLDVAVQSRTLANFLTHTTGAHVLMLDVTGDLAADQGARWPADSRAAMLRYTWLKSAQPPAQARLLAALPEALQQSSSLAQLDVRFAEYSRALASQYPQSSAYNRQVPDVLESLLLGKLP